MTELLSQSALLLAARTLSGEVLEFANCSSRSLVTFLNHQDVKNGVRIAVTITEAATWTVAAPATGAYDVSAKATACGTAAELPAVLEAAAPAIPVPPSSLSATIHTKPVTVTTVSPRTIHARNAARYSCSY